MNRHRTLVAWQCCHALALAVHRACERLPANQRFELGGQLRRAATSASANIAEGYARYGAGELAHGLGIALGSLAEVDALILLARDLGYLDGGGVADLEALRDRASASVFAFRSHLRRPPAHRARAAG